MKRCNVSSFTKLLALLLTAAFLLSLVPLLAVARYALPDTDDCIMADSVNSGDPSLAGIVTDAVTLSLELHKSWHGRYASTFLAVLALRLFSPAAYGVIPVLMLAVLIAATLFLTHVLLCRVLKLDFWSWLALSVLMLFCEIQFMPAIAEGVYWCCGAFTYTLSYAASELLLGMLLQIYLEKGRRRVNLLRAVLATLLAAAAAGLGFSVMILSLGLIAGFIVLAVTKKRRDCIVIGALVFAVYLAGSLIQLLAPGNAVRAAVEAERYGVIDTPTVPVAILKSFVFAAGCLIARLDGSMLLFLALTALLTAPAVLRSKYRFRLPGLVSVGAFCLFATTFAILMYAQNAIGLGRQRNIIVFLEYWFWGVNAVYWTGFAARCIEKRADAPALFARYRQSAALIRRHAAAALCVVAVLLLSTAFRLDVNTRPAVAAVRELASGSIVRRYETRMDELRAGEGLDRHERPEPSELFLY